MKWKKQVILGKYIIKKEKSYEWKQTGFDR